MPTVRHPLLTFLPTMDASDLDYDLPEAAIAQTPAANRADARLLVDRGPGQSPDHRRVGDLPEVLRPGDLLVVNDSRVIAGRLRVRRPSGGPAEVLLLERRDAGRWTALARPSRKLRRGDVLRGEGFSVELFDALGHGQWLVHVEGDLDGHGELPLPPYIRTPLVEPDRYQTVYARRPVSAAAPTAGLHLTRELLTACAANGVTVATVELAIGLDTFRPVTTERIEDHRIHTESYDVPNATWEACRRATRVVAVGTTVVRALETAFLTGERSGRSSLFITPGFEFRVVDVLLTNFHMPRTTLLALLDAFMGPRWREVYNCALRDGYRFLSFGDAMLVDRATSPT